MYRHEYSSISKQRFIAPNVQAFETPSLMWVGVTDDIKLFLYEWSIDGFFVVEVLPCLTQQRTYFFNTNGDYDSEHAQFGKFKKYVESVTKGLWPRRHLSIGEDAQEIKQFSKWKKIMYRRDF